MSKATLALALLLATTGFLVYHQLFQDSQLQIHASISSESMEETGTINMM